MLYLILSTDILLANKSDSISITITPVAMNYGDIEQSVNLSFYNGGLDTLVTVANMYIEGLSLTTIVYPLGNYYCPNLLILRPGDKTINEGDGKYTVNFNEFPKFFIFPPNSRREIIIETKLLSKLLAGKQWEINGIMCFAKLSVLDSTVREFFPERFETYRRYFIQSDTLTVEAQLSDSVKTTSIFKELEQTGKFNKLQNAFDGRINK